MLAMSALVWSGWSTSEEQASLA